MAKWNINNILNLYRGASGDDLMVISIKLTILIIKIKIHSWINYFGAAWTGPRNVTRVWVFTALLPSMAAFLFWLPIGTQLWHRPFHLNSRLQWKIGHWSKGYWLCLSWKTEMREEECLLEDQSGFKPSCTCADRQWSLLAIGICRIWRLSCNTSTSFSWNCKWLSAASAGQHCRLTTTRLLTSPVSNV